jgi:predicted nucleic acid-binding protein
VILVDTSCWIEFYRASGDGAVQDSVEAALRSGEVAVCDLVRLEVLAFIADPAEFELVSGDFASFRQLSSPTAVVDRAIALGRALRQKGVTAPATDLLIAGTALTHDAVLLHRDRHFEAIAEVCALRAVRADRVEQVS